MTKSDFTIALGGDLMITRPWSDQKEEGFLKLVEIIRNADVSVANLETLIHTFKGYPENGDQGTPMSSHPRIAREIAWAGFDMLSGATNHANDYGVIGTLESIEHVKEAGIALAGIGKDLQEARKPVYLQKKRKVALISATSTFDLWAKASMSTPQVAGRPGINPVTVKAVYSLMYQFARWTYNRLMRYGIILKSPKKKNIKVGDRNVSVGKEFSGNYEADKQDLLKNLELISEAKKSADLVIFSFHSHQGSQSTPPRFMKEFVYQAVDRGLDLFFSHGPHYIKGVEIYKGCPIFFGLGNLVSESDSIEKLPSPYYDKWKVDYSLPAEEVFKVSKKEFLIQKYWESVVPVIGFNGGKIHEITLYPVSLGMDKPMGKRGTPFLANQEDGERIIKRLATLSAPYQTDIEYDGKKNAGFIRNL